MGDSCESLKLYAKILWKPALINEGLRLFVKISKQIINHSIPSGNLPSLTRDCDNRRRCHRRRRRHRDLWKPALINEGLRQNRGRPVGTKTTPCGNLPSLTRDCDSLSLLLQKVVGTGMWKPALINEGLRPFHK